tara:strand:- start:199 stop:474 length:276 start_codon:yes stop_codon:yes gene_type:complete
MRRRTGTRYVPITISLKPAVVDDIETELSPGQSRSKWIAEAIDAKLHGGGGVTIGDASDKMLCHAFHARVCGCYEYDTCPTAIVLEKYLPA